MHILCDLYRRIFVSEIRGANNGGTLKKVAVVVEPPLRAKLVLLVHIPTRLQSRHVRSDVRVLALDWTAELYLGFLH